MRLFSRRRKRPGNSLALRHDYMPRRVELANRERQELPKLSFTVAPEGGVDVLLVPLWGEAYAARLPDDVGRGLLPALEQAGHALLPLVAADGDLGPLKALIKDDLRTGTETTWH